jgi:anti-sigma factor RsiW
MNPEMLDILIGKYLDSEITPAEQALLDRQLGRDPQARSLLDQFQSLDDLARRAVNDRIENSGEPFEAIFNRAFQRYQPGRWRFGWVRKLRLPAALAAGFLLGLFSVLLYTSGRPAQELPAPTRIQPEVAAADPTPVHSPAGVDQTPQAPQRQRQTDLYTFTDRGGTQWLIESHRDSDIQLAGYTGDL